MPSVTRRFSKHRAGRVVGGDECAGFGVASALDWYAERVASCDAFRLARSQPRGIMLTFDTAFCKPAHRVAGNIKVLRSAAK